VLFHVARRPRLPPAAADAGGSCHVTVAVTTSEPGSDAAQLTLIVNDTPATSLQLVAEQT